MGYIAPRMILTFPSYLWNEFSSSGWLLCFAHFILGENICLGLHAESLSDFSGDRVLQVIKKVLLLTEKSAVCFNEILSMLPHVPHAHFIKQRE